jgi:hypothetical protein
MFNFIKILPNSNLHYVLPTATLQETITEIQLIRPYNQLLLSTSWNQDELSAIMKNVPQDVGLLIPANINIKTLKSALVYLNPFRNIHLDDNFTHQEQISIVESLPAGVKFILPTHQTESEQIALLQNLPPYTIVACSNPKITNGLLSLILDNLNLYCIFEIHESWSNSVVKTIMQNIPENRGIVYKDYNEKDYFNLLRALPPGRIFALHNKIPQLVLDKALKTVSIGTIIHTPDISNFQHLEHLYHSLHMGNILHIHHENMVALLDGLNEFIGVQFSPHFEPERLLQLVRNFSDNNFYVAHPQEELSRIELVLDCLPDDCGFSPSSNTTEELWCHLCEYLSPNHWIMPALALNEREIISGLKYLKPFTQIIFDPQTLGDIQIAVLQNLPINVIFTPHPQIEFIHLLSNLEHLNSLAIYMPLIEDTYPNSYIIDSLDMLNPEAIFMPNLGMDDDILIYLLEGLRVNALFMPHPDIFEDSLFSILNQLPEHIRYVPNQAIDIETNIKAIGFLFENACITFHPQTSPSYATQLMSYFHPTHEVQLHRLTPCELYQSLEVRFFRNKEISLTDARFIHLNEPLAEALSIIGTLKEFATYEPHYSLSLDLMLECLKICPKKTILKPHVRMPTSILFQLLSAMPTHMIFSPHINLPVEKILEALDYVPTDCHVFANLQTPLFLTRNTRISAIFVTHPHEIEEFLNFEDSEELMTQKPWASRP